MKAITLPTTIDACLLSNAQNIYYLTGFTTLSAPGEHVAYLFLYGSTATLITYRLFEEEANAILSKNPELKLFFISREQSFKDILSSLYREHACTKLGIEASSLFLQEYSSIKQALPDVQMVELTSAIEPLRMIKEEHEIVSLQKACEITDNCFLFLNEILMEHMSETDLVWAIESYIRTHGGQLSFAPIVAIDEHSAAPHHAPSPEKQITKQSLVLLDFGASINGYHADLSRVLFVGEIKDEWKKAYQTVWQAKQQAEQYFDSSPEHAGAKADEIARKVITDAGYPVYPHSLGHGVGLEIHENPRLSVVQDEIITSGMTFTIEPAIYLSGQFGIRLEDTVCLTDQGLQKLTNSPFYEWE
jgi:Xaa-Pro aminopeptidase